MGSPALLQYFPSGYGHGFDLKQPGVAENSSNHNRQRCFPPAKKLNSCRAVEVGVAPIGEIGPVHDQVVESHSGCGKLRFNIPPRKSALCFKVRRHCTVSLDRSLTADEKHARVAGHLKRLRVAGRWHGPDYLQVSSTDDVASLLGGALDALLRLGPSPNPGMHSEVLDLHHVFALRHRASLVVWPGLAKCREFLKARSLLSSL
jgi:hypothetical protein